MYFFKSKHFENLDLWNIKNSISHSKNIEKLIDLSNKKKIKKILIFLIHLIRKQLWSYFFHFHEVTIFLLNYLIHAL